MALLGIFQTFFKKEANICFFLYIFLERYVSPLGSLFTVCAVADVVDPCHITRQRNNPWDSDSCWHTLTLNIISSFLF
jgi:hypothetical protein